jgi:hypothetical protein
MGFSPQSHSFPHGPVKLGRHDFSGGFNGFSAVAGVLLLTSIAFGTWQSRAGRGDGDWQSFGSDPGARRYSPPETGDWRLETGNWKLETGSYDRDAGDGTPLFSARIAST